VQGNEQGYCKGNLTVLRRILYLDLAKGNPKLIYKWDWLMYNTCLAKEIQREHSKNPWLGQTTNNILRITVPSLLVPSLP
jgi:hypothetical protein